MLFNWLVAPGSLDHVSCIDKCIYLGFDSRSPSEDPLLLRHGARHGAGLVLVAGPLPSFDFYFVLGLCIQAAVRVWYTLVKTSLFQYSSSSFPRPHSILD